MEYLNIITDNTEYILYFIGFLTGGTFLLPAKVAKYVNVIGKSAEVIATVYNSLEKTKAGLSGEDSEKASIS